MLLILLASLAIFRATLGIDCSRHVKDLCNQNDEETKFFLLIGEPKKEQLNEACPYAKDYTDCYSDVIQNCGFKKELHKFQTPYQAGKVRTFVNELCNSYSDVNKAYLNYADCMGQVIKANFSACDKTGEKTYADYRAYYGNEDGRNPASEKQCVTVTHMYACYAARIAAACGRVASRTFKDLIRRLEISSLFCTPEDLQSFQEFLMFYSDC